MPDTARPAPPPRFSGDFTRQEGLPDAAIAAAVDVLRAGRLHRYNAAPGTDGHTAALEAEFAAWQGARHALAVGSGGQAMQIALRAAGVAPGDRVLTNAFTLAPVPGAIAATGAAPVLVEITEDLVIDPGDLAAKAPGARAVLLSHMRGHQGDMDRIMAIAADHGLIVVEDCAHTMGGRWGGQRSGSHGHVACFSTQTYKHINSGEGGLLVSDDPGLMARAVMLSGAYMLHDRHLAGPAPAHYVDVRLDMPNMSARMDELRAAILRPQLAGLDANVARWAALHDRLAGHLRAHPGIALPALHPDASRVGSSLQFRLPGIAPAAAAALVARAAAGGVVLKWFGAPDPQGYTSAHRSWRYLPAQSLPRTDAVLAGLFDLRLPLTFGDADADLIAAHILHAVARWRAAD